MLAFEVEIVGVRLAPDISREAQMPFRDFGAV